MENKKYIYQPILFFRYKLIVQIVTKFIIF